jgi:hypothetical protein
MVVRILCLFIAVAMVLAPGTFAAAAQRRHQERLTRINPTTSVSPAPTVLAQPTLWRVTGVLIALLMVGLLLFRP